MPRTPPLLSHTRWWRSPFPQLGIVCAMWSGLRLFHPWDGLAWKALRTLRSVISSLALEPETHSASLEVSQPENLYLPGLWPLRLHCACRAALFCGVAPFGCWVFRGLLVLHSSAAFCQRLSSSFPSFRVTVFLSPPLRPCLSMNGFPCFGRSVSVGSPAGLLHLGSLSELF
ncbi:unnamed protein product [Symbiodinium sp. CCMP2592]|nr:unnamed protein product [Symbiodinium sp. CCMP2592]